MKISPEIASLIDEIRNDRVHGASQLARQAVQVLKTAAEHSQAESVAQFLAEQRLVGNELMSARPAMAPVYNIVSRLLRAVSEKSAEMEVATVRQLTITKADEASNDSIQAIARIAEHGSELITDSDRIITHSYSSTVMEMLKVAHAKHRNIEVIATRSGPGRTGERIAQELDSQKIPVTFIDDIAVGLYTSTVNKVMVGADRICADGNLINGIGTYQLSLTAKRAGIPFYVLCETLKFDPRLRSEEVDLEEKETSEVIEPGRLPPGVSVKNPYFDITPPELITGIVTENGVLKPEDVIHYMRAHPELK
jgi:ribose 1,5-bisphosphate isomerase